jgi:hypothetical protein
MLNVDSAQYFAAVLHDVSLSARVALVTLSVNSTAGPPTHAPSAEKLIIRCALRTGAGVWSVLHACAQRCC